MAGLIWHLKSCELFERLSESEAAHLNRRALSRSFKSKDLIYTPAEPGQHVLVLAAGRVKIFDVTPEGRETILAFVEPGEVFGEMAVLTPQPRSDFAVAVVASEVLAIPGEDILALLERRPDLGLSVTKLIGLRRQRIENRLRNILFLPSRLRLIRLLLDLTEAHGDIAGNRATIRFPLSHQDFAGLIGVSRETVTIALGELQADKLIAIERKRIAIVDLNRLREESGLMLGNQRQGTAAFA